MGTTNNENSHNEHITGLQDKLQNELIARFSDPNEGTNINNPFEFDCDLCHIEQLNKLNSNINNCENSVLYINIQSVPSKYERLKLLLDRLNAMQIEIKFILLCETFLNNNNVWHSGL